MYDVRFVNETMMATYSKCRHDEELQSLFIIFLAYRPRPFRDKEENSVYCTLGRKNVCIVINVFSFSATIFFNDRLTLRRILQNIYFEPKCSIA